MSNRKTYVSMIENALSERLPVAMGLLKEVPYMLSYSLEGGGKRIRPLLCLEFAVCCSGKPENALGFAVAVEFVHTYSLIHDDLPCMDNDSERRGKPSSHVRFGEANALLTGDALLTHAFSLISDSCERGETDSAAAIKAVEVLSSLAGINGMIGGQYIDLLYECKEASADVLFSMDRLKTAALIEAACVLGCISAGADENIISHAREFAVNLGLAFQIVDDLLDFAEDGSSGDVKSGKATYISIFGVEKARELAAEFTSKALSSLDYFGENAAEIRSIAENLLSRNK